MYYDRRGMPFTDDVLEWAREFEGDDRHLKHEVVKGRHGSFWISTVWLGIDHSFGSSVRPLVFETMAFQIRPKAWNDVIGEMDFSGFAQVRSSTEDEAMGVHRAFVQRLG